MLVHVCSCVPPVWSWLVERESDPVDPRGGGVWQPGLERVLSQWTPADIFQGFDFTAFWKSLFICGFSFILAFTQKLWKVFDAFVGYRCMTMEIQSLIPKNSWASWSIMRVHWTLLTRKIWRLTHYWSMVQASPSQYVDLPFNCITEVWVLQFEWKLLVIICLSDLSVLMLWSSFLMKMQTGSWVWMSLSTVWHPPTIPTKDVKTNSLDSFQQKKLENIYLVFCFFF